MNKWQLPVDWKWKTLAEISEINPRRPSIERDASTPTSFVPMKDVDEVEGEFKQIQVRPYEEVRRGYTYFEENDVLFAKITPSMENGKTAIAQGLIDGFGFGTTEFHVLRPHENILPDYLHYYIRRVPFRQEAQQHFRGAVGQQRVPKDFLLTYPFPVPFPGEPKRSLAEQRRIVVRIEALLAEVREMRQLHEDITADTNKLLTTFLRERFDELREEYELGGLGNEDLCEVIAGQHILSRNYTESPPGTPYITGPADFGEKYPNVGRWTSEPKVLSQRGDVLFTVKGSGVGKVNCAPLNGETAIGRQIMAIRPNPTVLLTDYLFYNLHSRFEEFQQLRQGAAIPGIRKDHVQSIELPVPPVRVQEQVVSHLETVHAEIKEMKETNLSSQELLVSVEQAVLTQAFRGDL